MSGTISPTAVQQPVHNRYRGTLVLDYKFDTAGLFGVPTSTSRYFKISTRSSRQILAITDHDRHGH
eukprot:SAG11_NODE_6_length_32111_cov_33.703174_10_plen_66_part_00